MDEAVDQFPRSGISDEVGDFHEPLDIFMDRGGLAEFIEIVAGGGDRIDWLELCLELVLEGGPSGGFRGQGLEPLHSMSTEEVSGVFHSFSISNLR